MPNGDRLPDLAVRTKKFALRVIRAYSSLPRTDVAQILGRQMLRSGTSAGAHYREGRRARSDAELVSKFETALQELDETQYWMELLIEEGIVPDRKLRALWKEADELIAILVVCVLKVKRRMQDEK